MRTGGEIDLALIDSSGVGVPARCEAACRDRIEGGFRKVDISLTVRWAGGEIVGESADYFHALCEVRRRIEPLGLTPNCYGACRNLVMTGMAIDMGLGGKGYLVRLGHPVSRTDLVRTFEVGPEMDLVTVAEQEAFKAEWLSSIGRGELREGGSG